MQTNTQALLVVALGRNFYLLCISSESVHCKSIPLSYREADITANCSCFSYNCFSSLVVFLDLQTLNDISPWSNNKTLSQLKASILHFVAVSVCTTTQANQIYQLNGCDEIQEIVTMFAVKTTSVKNNLKALSCRQKWFWLKDELRPEVSFLYYLSWDLRPNPSSLLRDKRSSAKKTIVHYPC